MSSSSMSVRDAKRLARNQKARNKRLLQAVIDGNAKSAHRLLTAGADPNARDFFNDTPLHHACRGGNIELVKILLTAGANTDVKGRDNYTPLHCARYRLADDHPARETLRRLLGDPELPLQAGETVAFFDCETNGLDNIYASVLSFSAIRAVAGPGGTLTEVDRFDRYYYPQEPYNDSAIAVNGLTEHEITRCRDSATYPRYFREDLEVVNAFFEGIDLAVAHNLGFDSSFLPFRFPRMLCTMLANTYVINTEFPDGTPGKWPSLKETCDYYDVELSNWHSSMADVEAVMAIYVRMMARNK